MRVSRDPDDFALGDPSVVRFVMLDGEVLPLGSCLMADDEAGEVLVHDLDEHGKPKFNPFNPGMPMAVLKRGRVTIITAVN